ncbi:MAG: glycosyltransferase [Clostridia bacterium]|nr:glycosyltransferase [Clostridia bacterium]
MGHNVIAFPLFLQSESFLSDPRNNYSKKIFDTVADNVSLYIKDLKLNSSKGVKKSALKSAAKQYRKILKTLPEIDLLVVHEPTSTYDLTDYLRIPCHKVAVFTTKDARTLTTPKFARYSKIYDAFGFTLDSVRRRIDKIIKTDKPCVVTCSETPNFVMPATIDKVWDNDKLRLLFIGELTPFKNLDIIINAIAKTRNKDKMHLDIIGTGSMEPALHRLIANLDLANTVTLRGATSKVEAFKIMRESDVFVMANCHVTFGLAYLEAMSQGCIPICVEDDRIDGIVQDGLNGYILKEKDTEALTNRLDQIAEMSRTELAKISKSTIETVSELTEEKIAARYLDVVLSTVETKKQKKK